MRELKKGLALVLALLSAAAIAPAASARQSPEGCVAADPSITFSAATTKQLDHPVRDGDRVDLGVQASNQSGTVPCDISDLTVKVKLPNPDGSPGESVTFASGVELPSGSAKPSLDGTLPYVVNLNQGIFQAPITMSFTGIVHSGDADVPIAGDAGSTKLNLTRPAATLTVTPDVTSGPPPLSVNFTYQLSNTSPLASAGLLAPRLVPNGGGDLYNAISDPNCGAVSYLSGDLPTLIEPSLDPGETWTFSCSRTFTLPGTYSSRPSITASSSADGRPWPQPAAVDTTVTALGPDLVVDKSHNGNFQAGTPSKYKLKVTNNGNLGTSGTVSVTDQLPAGLTASAITGKGWGCDLATLTCSRSDPLASGSAYPDVTLTATPVASPPVSVINTASVSGGGEVDGVLANNSDSDPTTIRIPGLPAAPVITTFSVIRLKSRSDGSIAIKVSAPGKGFLAVDDAKKPDLVPAAGRKIKRSGNFSLVVKAGPRLRRLIRKNGPRKVKLKITFNPKKSSPVTVTRTALFRLPS